MPRHIFLVVQHAHDFIQMFVNINWNIKSYRKITEKVKEYTYKITNIPDANALEQRTWYHIKDFT